MTRCYLQFRASGRIGIAISPALAANGSEMTWRSRSSDGFDIAYTVRVEELMRSIRGTFYTVLNAIGPALTLRSMPRHLARDESSVVRARSARVGSIGVHHLRSWYPCRTAKAAPHHVERTAAAEIARQWKEAVDVILHRGTMATAFGRAYLGQSKIFPDGAAANLVAVVDRLMPAKTGGFFGWAGKPVPW